MKEFRIAFNENGWESIPFKSRPGFYIIAEDISLACALAKRLNPDVSKFSISKGKDISHERTVSYSCSDIPKAK